MSDVIILGAGPAGSAVALGLARLGISVRIFARPRPDAIEGISQRTQELLRTCGLTEAAESCSTAAPRIALWAGTRIAGNTESIVRRATLDRAFGRDLGAAGIEVVPKFVRSVRVEGQRFRLQTETGEHVTSFVVDARGRRTRRADELGPRLIAWSELCALSSSVSSGSALLALQHGWCWIACAGSVSDARMLVQYVGSTKCGRPPSSEIAAAIQTHLPGLVTEFTGREPLTVQRGRAAVARFSIPARVPGLLRVGDAAVATDPLSGHGVFEALRSARVAVAAVNSCRMGVPWETIARFVNERAAEVWSRSLLTSAEFYGRQATHTPNEFWTATANGYAALGAQVALKHQGPDRMERRPVLNGACIEMRDVWVNAKYPRGIWMLNGHEWHATSRERGS